MSIVNTPHNSPFPFWENESEGSQTEPGTRRYLPVPNAESLRNTSLFGIPLRSNLTGQTLTDDILETYITKAISQLEHTLDIYITPVQFTERHDYDRKMFQQSFAWFKVNHSPILDVQQVRISFSNQHDPQPSFVEFPLEHVYANPQEGAIRLVPAYGSSISGFLISAFAGAQIHALLAAGLDVFPGAVRITYRAGFEKDKIPAVIAGLIEKMAALNVLSTVGPLLFPYSSTSIGIDGVSQGVGTPGPQFLAQRINDLKEQIQSELDVAKGYYLKRTLVDFI
jgi:hypothetical protein